MRAIRVASGSLAGAPQFEQNRTPGATYAPQPEQVISFSPSLLLERTDFEMLAIILNALQIQNEAETSSVSASLPLGANIY
jgi:hypothetical protein